MSIVPCKTEHLTSVIKLGWGCSSMAALHSTILSGICFWPAIIMTIVAAVKASPKPAPGQTDDYDDQLNDSDDDQRRRQWDRDRRREEEYYLDGFDREQREHEDCGEVYRWPISYLEQG